MSHFYAEIDGRSRSTATRVGTKDSGISGNIRGWNVGAKVHCRYNNITDSDICNVYATKGSSGNYSELLATIEERPNGKISISIYNEFIPNNLCLQCKEPMTKLNDNSFECSKCKVMWTAQPIGKVVTKESHENEPMCCGKPLNGHGKCQVCGDDYNDI